MNNEIDILTVNVFLKQRLFIYSYKINIYTKTAFILNQ